MQVVLVIFIAILVSIKSEIRIPISRVTNSFNDKLALEVLKVTTANTVVSPFFLKFPLCKLADVAEGRAKIELMIALGFSKGGMLQNCYSRHVHDLYQLIQTDLLMSTKIYLNESLDVDRSFMENSTINYGLRVENVGFRYSKAAADFINRWIERDMLKRVTDIVDAEDINSRTSMVILNAAEFRGSWNTPFYTQMTTDKQFRNQDGTVFKIPMMVTVDDVMYVDDINLNVKVFTLELVDGDITFALPTTVTGLSTFITKIHEKPSLMKELKESMKRKILTISVPKFQIKTYVDWTDFLKIIGINKIFSTTNSGLNKILKNNSSSKVYLSKVKQKVSMVVDELGAVRTTPSEADQMALPRMQAHMDKNEEITLDRPFYFSIAFGDHGSTDELFAGVFYGPNEV